MNPHFLASEISNAKPEEALFHLVPVPHEHSVSYGGGTAAGPARILSASSQLETHDQLGGEPYRYGIHTQEALACDRPTEALLQDLRQRSRAIAAQGKIPFILGGEHSISYGSVMGCHDVYGKIGVVQIDAHADLRHEYEGSIWSHACVMKRLVDEALPILQLGVRALSVEEMQLRAERPNQIFYRDAKDLCNPPQHQFHLPETFPELIYLTVDIDGLDGSIMPATGTPVAGGLSWWQLIDLIQHIASQRRIIGMDLVEFAPLEHFHAYDFMAADLAHKMMGIVGRSRA